jgi:hypothetical protein
MTNLFGNSPSTAEKTLFIPLGGPKAHDCSGRDDKSVRQMPLKREKSPILQQVCHLDRSEA